MVGMEFKKHVIIFGKTIYGIEIYVSLRNMKNVFKMKISTRGIQDAMTNISNPLTCPAGHVDLLATMVLVAEAQLLEFSGDVIHCAGVHVPVRVNAIRTGSGRGSTLLGWSSEGCIESFVALDDGVALLAIQLAKHARLEPSLWTTAIVTALVAAAKATAATVTPSTGVVVGVVPTAALGRHVRRDLMAPSVDLHALLERRELRVQFRNRDRLDTRRHSRYDRVESEIQPDQYVGDELLIF
jgi:hypothetical protein